jgi:hypothetical protein
MENSSDSADISKHCCYAIHNIAEVLFHFCLWYFQDCRLTIPSGISILKGFKYLRFDKILSTIDFSGLIHNLPSLCYVIHLLFR